VCEHASAFIPPALNDLGLTAEGRASHAAWDIGALAMAEAMRDALDAPLIEATVSRLVYDCNRPPEAKSAMPTKSERIDVPGNAALSDHDRTARVAQIYEPFTEMLADLIAHQEVPPAIVTLHSFTPVYHGTPRRTEIGLLHDDDASLATAMLRAAPAHTDLSVELNQPYDRSDGVTHTLALHGSANALPSVMIEVRNDLVSDPAEAARIGRALAAMLREALT